MFTKDKLINEGIKDEVVKDLDELCRMITSFSRSLNGSVGGSLLALISNNRHARKIEKKINLAYLQYQSGITERACFFDATIHHCFEAFRNPRAVL